MIKVIVCRNVRWAGNHRWAGLHLKGANVDIGANDAREAALVSCRRARIIAGIERGAGCEQAMSQSWPAVVLKRSNERLGVHKIGDGISGAPAPAADEIVSQTVDGTAHVGTTIGGNIFGDDIVLQVGWSRRNGAQAASGDPGQVAHDGAASNIAGRSEVGVNASPVVLGLIASNRAVFYG